MKSDSPDEIVLILYNDVDPFEEVTRLQTIREHFDACTLAIDRRDLEDFFFIVVFYPLNGDSNTACKLVKVPLT